METNVNSIEGISGVLDLFKNTKSDVESCRYRYLESGVNTFDLSKIENLEVVDDDFTKNGITSKRKRLSVKFSDDRVWIMPLSLHEKLEKCVENGDYLVNIIKSGIGLDTEYTVEVIVDPAK